MIKNIVFDFGGVIVDIDRDKAVQAFILHITSQKAFTTKLSSLSSMGARPHSPGCAILTQIHY